VIVRLGMLALLIIILSSQASADAYQLVQTVEPKAGLAETSDIKEIEIARFYVRKGDYTGAVNRCKVILMYFPTSAYADETLALLTEFYVAFGVPSEAQTAAAVLNRKYPKSDWTRIAGEILKAAGLEAQEDENSWISRALK
jgi:outer membrane protein assembly factor BamD